MAKADDAAAAIAVAKTNLKNAKEDPDGYFKKGDITAYVGEGALTLELIDKKAGLTLVLKKNEATDLATWITDIFT